MKQELAEIKKQQSAPPHRRSGNAELLKKMDVLEKKVASQAAENEQTDQDYD